VIFYPIVGMPPPEREWVIIDGDSSNDDFNGTDSLFSNLSAAMYLYSYPI
jgi:hypothetical protein